MWKTITDLLGSVFTLTYCQCSTILMNIPQKMPDLYFRPDRFRACFSLFLSDGGSINLFATGDDKTIEVVVVP